MSPEAPAQNRGRHGASIGKTLTTKKHLTIALDAMGGDTGPEVVIPGAALCAERHPDIRFLLVGDRSRIAPLVERYPKLKQRAEIHHTEVFVTMDAKPSQALRQGRGKSSMWLAIDAVRTGAADAAVSAGNTGALMAMARFVLKTLPGISRPAIAAMWPTMRSESVVLDVGVEEIKGQEQVKEAGRILRDSKLPIEYAGFVEGDDIGKGTVDVVVTEGFTGNIALKAAEGTAKQLSTYLRLCLQRTLLSRIGAFLAQGAFRALKDRMDPRKHNGGVFLGLNGVVVKSHGGTDALGFATAIDMALQIVRNDLVNKIKTDVELMTGLLKHREAPAEASL